MSPKSRNNNRSKLGAALVALLTAVVWLVYKILPPAPPPPASHKTTPVPASAPNSSTRAGTGRLVGSLTDRNDSPVSQLIVSLKGGPEARTDEQGQFVLNGVTAGDQTIVVKSPNINIGQFTRNINIAEGVTTETNIIYDPQTGQLGLLSVGAPVDDGELLVKKLAHKDGTAEHRATVYGHFDGLAQILGNFDIWVIVRSETDGRLWVQQPPAIPDQLAHSWAADVTLGDATHPPVDGERWYVMAVAAESTSDMRRVLNTPSLSQLPPHISSNRVTAVVRIVETKRP